MATATLPLHPWNSSFEWVDRAGPFQILTDEQVGQFDQQGYVVVEGVFTGEEIAAVRAECDRIDEKSEEFLKGLDGGRFHIAEAGAITFSANLVTKNEVLRAFSAHPKVAAICADLVGPDVALYWDQAVYKKPEKPRRFPWHQDNGYTFIEPQQYLTLWVPLTDATPENGCPHVAPGVHRLGTLEHTFVDPLGWECFSDPPSEVVAPVRAGGVVIFSSLTPHLTGPNVTDDVRKAYILQYSPIGAEILRGNPNKGPAIGREPCDTVERHYSIVRGGERVDPPPVR